MRPPKLRFHMSNGAWIFATGVAVALIGSTGIYAAANSNSIFAIGNSTGTTTAYVAGTRQLQTVTIAPGKIVFASGGSASGCHTIYTPPTGNAIVVTQITYDLGSGTQGSENFGGLYSPGCSAIYDQVDTVQPYITESHTFPTGLPMTEVAVGSGGNGFVSATVTGYLIPANQLPAEPPQVHGSPKALAGMR